ncbi:enoyl-CoA hydratase/isomerase family protein [Kribbella sp. NPDC050124]|uniref:enoyl-CoA hydratase/isomerase family protein n=1 Tax=Kribbella sp. NPDC050124 TaxID=3364114 RepID=UPI003796026C
MRLHDHLVEERDGAVVVLRIDREEALGALSRSLVETLGEHLDRLHGDPGIRVLVLTGTGRGFVAGADIGEYDRVTPAAFDEYQRLSRRTFSALERLPQFTIAAVNGYALGGGMELALCCDLIMASERAKFGLPEVKLGLIPGGGGTQRLARAAGIRFAKEATVTGRFYRPEQLRGRGVVSAVCPPEELMPTVMRLAQTIAANAPLAVRAAKRIVDLGADVPLEVGLGLEQQALSDLYRSRDAAEGIAAFIEKRDPKFTGD